MVLSYIEATFIASKAYWQIYDDVVLNVHLITEKNLTLERFGFNKRFQRGVVQ